MYVNINKNSDDVKYKEEAVIWTRKGGTDPLPTLFFPAPTFSVTVLCTVLDLFLQLCCMFYFFHTPNFFATWAEFLTRSQFAFSASSAALFSIERTALVTVIPYSPTARSGRKRWLSPGVLRSFFVLSKICWWVRERVSLSWNTTMIIFSLEKLGCQTEKIFVLSFVTHVLRRIAHIADILINIIF